VITVRIARKAPIATGVVTLSLIQNDSAPLPHFAPGSHVELRLPGGQSRQYSLCGDPADRRCWRVAVRREAGGRGGSAYIHDVLAEGDELVASEPRNHFPLHEAGSYLFIAGGIGITPLLPMIAEVERRGRPWRLAYGGRSRKTMAFLDELAGYGDRVSLWPAAQRGRMDLAALLAGAPAGAPGKVAVFDRARTGGYGGSSPREAGAAVYCCGPAPLLDEVAKRHAELGFPAQSLHVERFIAEEGATACVGEPFEVELASTGQVVSVTGGQSVLSALRESGVDVLSSCEEGTCGTCETPVLAGVPDHRDTVLTPAERAACDLMMVCVSRSKTPRLVLDL
jgi:ferredoxin-NADP reductase